MRSTFLLQTGPADTPAQKIEATCAVQKPAQLAVIVKFGEATTSFHADGKTLVIDEQPANTFAETPAPESLRLILQRLAPGLSDLLDPDPKSKILEGATQLSLVGDDSIDGAACHRLRFTQTTGVADVWFEAGSQPLLRRLVMRMKDKFGTAIDVRFDHWDTAPKLDAKTFAFTPQPGAKKIDPAARQGEKVENIAPITVQMGTRLATDFRKLHHAGASES